jgi:hypothetical protein
MFYYKVMNEFGMFVDSESFETAEARDKALALKNFDSYYTIWVGQDGQPAKQIQ